MSASDSNPFDNGDSFTNSMFASAKQDVSTIDMDDASSNAVVVNGAMEANGTMQPSETNETAELEVVPIGSHQAPPQIDPQSRCYYQPVGVSSSGSTPLNTANSSCRDRGVDAEFIEISITEPQKIGDGMSSYVAYRITTHTNMSLFKQTEFSVVRRFSDFLGLHEKLTGKYLKLGRIIPAPPQKNVFGTTKIKMSGGSNRVDVNSLEGTDFVERRRAGLERFLKRCTQHPVLVIDPDFREFLEADVELPRATTTSALSGASVLRLFNKVGETVNKITYKMEESDPWFEDRLVHIDTLETYLRKLYSSVESLVECRRELSHLTNGVSRAAAMLSASEDHNALSRTLSELADTEEKVEAVHMDQATTDFYILCEPLRDYLRLLAAVRDTFHERTKLFQYWQHSQGVLLKKRESRSKLEAVSGGGGGGTKLEQANQEIIEWESKVERGQEGFDNISRIIKAEVERFEQVRLGDFHAMFLKYLENHLSHQAQLVKFWDEFLCHVKTIA